MYNFESLIIFFSQCLRVYLYIFGVLLLFCIHSFCCQFQLNISKIALVPLLEILRWQWFLKAVLSQLPSPFSEWLLGLRLEAAGRKHSACAQEKPRRRQRPQVLQVQGPALGSGQGR